MLTDAHIQRLLDIAYAGCHRGMVLEARSIFSALLRIRPNLAPAILGFAFSLMVVDEFSEAEALLREEVLAHHPDDKDALLLLGLCLGLAGRGGEAGAILMDAGQESGPRAATAQALLEHYR